MDLDPDIEERVRLEFPPEAVTDTLRKLVDASATPRIQRCIIFAARGNPWYFDYLCKIAKRDYRDVIKAAEYGLFDIYLYDFNRPFSKARNGQPSSA